MKIKDLSLLTPEQKIELILLQSEENHILKEELTKYKAKIKGLEAKFSKNSRNSHKSPSSDQKKTQSTKPKSTNKPGGQPGHKGHHLEMNAMPDEVIKHTADNCLICGAILNKGPVALVRRQVFEVPTPRIWVTEHQAEVKDCSVCGLRNKAFFPKGVAQPTQYGTRAKGLMVYLSQQQLLPYHRIRQLFQDLFNHTVSAGTVVNAVSHSAHLLEAIDSKIKSLLRQSNILHCDESGANISGDKHWLHVTSNEKLTHYAIHKKRGSEATEEIGILPDYKGTLIHDHWRSYFKYTQSKHGLCNAHILRELKYIHEVQGLSWASRMSELLLEIKAYKEEKIKQDQSLSLADIESFVMRYHKILTFARRQQSCKGTRDSKNLIKRLANYQEEILRFMTDFNVPFSNNQAERDIRMLKVQQKITGGFRKKTGADHFCINRSVLSTAMKNGKNLLSVLQDTFKGELVFQQLVAN